MADDFDPEFEARAAGYEWPEIDQHIAESSDAALNEGYTKEEIDQHLGRRPGTDVDEDLNAAWYNHFQNGGDADLFQGPNIEGLYGSALRDRTTTGPQDFADRHAAAAYQNGDGSLDDLAVQSGQLAGMLPNRRDFIDSSLGLPGPDAYNNLLDHYGETGQQPEKAVAQARTDAQLYAKLSAEKPPAGGPGFFDRLGTGIADIVVGANQFLEHSIPGFKEAADAAYNSLGGVQLPTDDKAMDQYVKIRDRVTKEQGYDGWARLGGQVIATAPLFTALGLEGLGGMIAAGATGGLAQAAFTPTTAEDYWTAKAEEMAVGGAFGAAGGAVLHGAVKGIGAMISKMTPEAAAELGKAAPELLDPMVTEIREPGAPTPTREIRASEATGEVKPAEVHIEETRANADGTTTTSTTKIEGDREAIATARERLQEQHLAEGGEHPLPVVDPEAPAANALDTLHEFGMAKAIVPKADAGGYWQGLYQAAVEAGHVKASPAIEALAAGRDTVDGAGGLKDQILGMLPRSIRDIWSDESGTLLSPTLRTPMQRRYSQLNFEAREVERTSLRQTMGLNNQMRAGFKEGLQGLERALMPHEGEWAANKGPTGTPNNTVIGQFLNAIEDSSVRLSPSHPLAGYVDMVKNFYAVLDHEAKIRDADPQNPFNMSGYIKDYLAHMVEDPDKAAKTLLGTPGGGAELGSKTGRMGNFMQRNGPPKLTDLVANGIPLKHDRIFPMLMDDLRARSSLFQYADHIQEGVGSGQYVWSAKGPPVPGWTPVGGRFAEKQFIASPEVGSLRAPEAAIARQYAQQNGVSYKQAVQDLATQGQVTPRTAQDVLNEQRIGTMQLYGMPSVVKQLDLWRDIAAYKNTSNQGIWDSLLYAKNALTGMKLAFAGFHFNTIALGSMAGTFGRAIETAGYGLTSGNTDLMKAALKDLGMWATPYATLGRDMYMGVTNKGLILEKPTAQNMLDPMYRIAQSLVRNNFNFGGLTEMEKFTGQSKGLIEALGDGRSLAQWASDQWNKGFDAGVLPQEYRESFRKILGDPRNETPDRRALLGVPRAIDFALREAARHTQAVTGSESLFKTMIPSVKYGQALDRGQRYLMAHPNATPEQLDNYMRKVSMDLDNRLGEMMLDNTFASQTLKRSVNIATISTSWVYGSYRGFAQALGYNLERHVFSPGTEGLRSFFPQQQAWEWNPVATSNLIGTLSSLALVNQVYSYLHGQGVGTDIRDLWTFATGGKGSLSFSSVAERASFPSELKELTDIGTIIARSANVWSNAPIATAHYALGKLNPFWQSIMGFTTGEDGIGHKIGAYPGGLERFLLDQITPIALSAVEGGTKQTGLNWVERLMGIREAPKWIEDWNKYEGQVMGQHDRDVKSEMARARKEVSEMQSQPWWADQVTPAKPKLEPAPRQSRQQQAPDPNALPAVRQPRQQNRPQDGLPALPRDRSTR